MNQRIDELMKMMPNDVDVTECKNMAERITETGTMILANATFCVTEKIDQASRSIESINAITNDVIIMIRDMNEKSTECTKNSAFSLKMVGCMARVNDLLSFLTFVPDNRSLTMLYNDINTITFRSRSWRTPPKL